MTLLNHYLDQDSMWFVRPQLFFHCTLRPIGTVAGSYNSSDEDIPLDLIFFSPFEELRLRTAGIMESKGIHRVYEPSPVPALYVGRVEDLLCRVPLIPCFLDIGGSECGRDRPGFGGDAVSEKLRRIQYYRV